MYALNTFCRMRTPGQNFVRGNRFFKVLFCGEGHFMSAFQYTKEILESTKNTDIQVIQCDDRDLVTEIADTDMVIPFMSKINKDILSNANNLKLIMQFGVGLEGVDIAEATSKHIFVSRIPSGDCGNAASVAEHAIYLSLCLLRDQSRMGQSIREGIIGVPTGRTLLGSTVLIYGYGNIGKHLASRLSAFGTKVLGIKRSISSGKDDFDPGLLELGDVSSFRRMAGQADIVIMCCDQNPSTHRIVNEEFISHMKNGAFLVNIARGGLLHYPDVHKALETGKLGGLGIDVFHTEPFPLNDSMLDHPRVVATPHVAGVTTISYRNMAAIAADNALRIFSGQMPKYVVNDVI